ncbi:BOLA class I histocompatibility antigen, alpha chain BL3-7-like isoform X2 [Esox lucius]|uniref:BOLA class I histocompatibility antigen, alpha chain BL3-7-like isoform X2 n=1 Tax=Esox lucius TaxID=8010 RepID=UPI001476CD06|nr:BOLA class I histocompatibility antigen, alpha chain BL3-7-like isoform X2 [Esox lucius]
MKVILLILGIELLPTVSAAFHSLKHTCTALSGDTNFPEFTALSLLDNVQVAYFDSNTKTVVPKTEWIRREGPDYLTSLTDISIDGHQRLKAHLQIFKDQFNQSMSTGVHTLQVMMGCEWDEETGVTEGFLPFGYDGEDFISFDLKTLTWITSKPQAVITKDRWDNDKADNEYWKNYLTQECIEWLKKFLDYRKSSLMRTVPPSVSLLQKTPSSPVTCHATGFYTREVIVTWKKDGQDHHEDVEMGETLHNDDGTFQKSVHLTVKPEEWKNNKYQCVVQDSGINEVFIKVLTEDEIETNWDVKDPNTTGLITAVVVTLLLVIVAAFIWKKKTRQASGGASTSSNNSAPEAQVLSQINRQFLTPALKQM